MTGRITRASARAISNNTAAAPAPVTNGPVVTPKETPPVAAVAPAPVVPEREPSPPSAPVASPTKAPEDGKNVKHLTVNVSKAQLNHAISFSIPSSAALSPTPSTSSSVSPTNSSSHLSPPAQPAVPDPVHDLAPELLQIGWRKFWSKREGRPYFFNKITNESLWETPRLNGQHEPYDIISDPLGIQSSPVPPTPTDPGTPNGPIPGGMSWPPRIGEKRSLSADDASASNFNKKIIVT